MIAAIASVLTPELLKPAYRGLPGGPTAGHCYHAAEALFHAYGGRESGWTPQVYRDPDDGITHWWLRHRDGRIADPTAEQFTSRGLPLPYHLGLGKACGFLTSKPSARAQRVLERVQILDACS